MVYRFADHFWNTDFNGTSGYETLITRLKDGKKLCDVFIDFLRARVKIEEDYGKSLIRLGQSAGTNDEAGTLKNAWIAVTKEAESIGTVHCEMAKKLNEMIDRTSKFREQQKNDRSKTDDKMRKLQRDKKAAYDTMSKNKRTYELRSKESQQCNDALDSKATYTPKEEEKLKKNQFKAKTQAENADSIYQSSIKNLEDARNKWQLDMEDTCELFQRFEVNRIQFLRNEMWVYTNLESLRAVDIDHKSEDCRTVIEKCDESADIQQFINIKQTGSERPAPILYESYAHHSPTGISASQSSHQLHVLGRNVMPPRSSSGPLVPVPRQSSVKEDAYASISEVRTARDGVARIGKGFYRVVYEYEAQGPKELCLKPGDLIEVLEIEDDMWALGRLNGKKGAFPLSFTEPWQH